MKRFMVIALVLVSLVLAMSASASAGGGNAAAAHACQQNGWYALFRADGSAFANAGECVSYAARGGTLEQLGGEGGSGF